MLGRGNNGPRIIDFKSLDFLFHDFKPLRIFDDFIIRYQLKSTSDNENICYVQGIIYIINII